MCASGSWRYKLSEVLISNEFMSTIFTKLYMSCSLLNQGNIVDFMTRNLLKLMSEYNKYAEVSLFRPQNMFRGFCMFYIRGHLNESFFFFFYFSLLHCLSCMLHHHMYASLFMYLLMNNLIFNHLLEFPLAPRQKLCYVYSLFEPLTGRHIFLWFIVGSMW